MTQVSNPLNPIQIAPKVEEKPKTPVDIFGNPIQDVEKWLREQDRNDLREARKAPEPAESRDAPRPRFLKSLLSRLVPGPSDPKHTVTY